MSADTRRSTSRFRGVLSLYASAHGNPPMLEIRIKRMCRTPPYDRHETLRRFTAELRALGVPRLDAEPDLPDKRPNIPLEELTSGRAERLLALVDKWIDEVRAHADEPESANES